MALASAVLQTTRGLILALGLCGLACAAAERPSDPAAWRRIAMAEALKTADEISDPYRLAMALASAARAQTLIDDSDGAEASLRRALDVASRIPQSEFKGWALHDIVAAQIAADDLIGARQTADLIVAERPQSAALAAIAEVELRGRKIASAQGIAARIRDENAAGAILRQIVVLQLNAGAVSVARETARRIRSDFYEGLALGDIAITEFRLGNAERAVATAARAPRAERGQALGRVAIARAQRGDMQGALDTLARMDDVFYRSLVQGQLANLRAAADAAAAREMYRSAFAALDEVRDRDHRLAGTLSQLARLQIAGGERDAARGALQRAIAAANELTNEEQRDSVLDEIARGQLRLGDTQAALATALQIKNRISRALLIRDTVSQQVRAGAEMATVRSSVPVDDPLIATAALFGVLGTQLTLAGRPGAADTITQARGTVRAIDDAQLKPAAFASLAAARVTLGDAEGGWEIFQEAQAASSAIERPDQRAAAYVRVVNALNDRLVFLGQPAKTATP